MDVKSVSKIYLKRAFVGDECAELSEDLNIFDLKFIMERHDLFVSCSLFLFSLKKVTSLNE